MEKDKEITEIIFRTGINGISKGETFAIFPYYVYNWRGNVMSFTPFEGHGEAEYEFCIRKSRPATEQEKRPVLQCLEQNYGYNIKEIKKRCYSKFLKVLQNELHRN